MNQRHIPQCFLVVYDAINQLYKSKSAIKLSEMQTTIISDLFAKKKTESFWRKNPWSSVMSYDQSHHYGRSPCLFWRICSSPSKQMKLRVGAFDPNPGSWRVQRLPIGIFLYKLIFFCWVRLPRCQNPIVLKYRVVRWFNQVSTIEMEQNPLHAQNLIEAQGFFFLLFVCLFVYFWNSSLEYCLVLYLSVKLL